MTWLSFAEVKRNVSIHQTAQLLHLELHQLASGWYRGWCPRCEAHTLIIAMPYGQFFCAAGKQGGDQLSLYAHCKSVNIKDAAERLVNHYTPHTNGSRS